MISVTIPTLNEDPTFFRECLNSIKNQTLKVPYEVIIIDDGSENKHEIRGIAGEFGAKYFYQENAGIGATRGKGVELANGDYILTLASHDLLMPNFIDEMLKASEKNPNAFLFCDYIVIDASGATTGIFRAPTFDFYDDFLIAVVSAAKRNTMFVAYTLFAPSELFKKYNFDPEKRFGEDLEHLLRCLLVEKLRFAHVPIPLFKYRVHPLNVTSQKLGEIPENNRRTFEKINRLLGRVVL